MTQFNTLNVKFSNSQLIKLKWVRKNGIVSNLSSNVIGDSRDHTKFPNKLLLIDTS